MTDLPLLELMKEIQRNGPVRLYYTGQDSLGSPVQEVVDVACANYNTAQKTVARYAKDKGHTHLRLHDFRFRAFDDFSPAPPMLDPADWL